MGFDTGTLTRAEMDGFLEDHKVELEKYIAPQVVGEAIPMKAKKDSIRKWDRPLGYGFDGDRSPNVNFGEPHPRGKSGMEKVDFDAGLLKWAEDIEEGDLQEMEEYVQAASDLSLAAGHVVLRARDALLETVVAGNGTSGTDTDISSYSIPTGEGWATATSPIIDHIRDAQDAIGGSELICVMGRDRARQLSLNDYFTGAEAGSGDAYLMFSALADKLADEGISNVFFGGAKYVNGERDFDSGFANMFSGVFYLGTPENLKMGEFWPLQYDELEDDDKNILSYAAKWSGCFRRAYVQNSISFTNFAGS